MLLLKCKVLATIGSFLVGNLLMSSAYINGITYYSTVAESNVPIISVLSSGSNTVNQEANTATLNIDVI